MATPPTERAWILSRASAFKPSCRSSYPGRR